MHRNEYGWITTRSTFEEEDQYELIFKKDYLCDFTSEKNMHLGIIERAIEEANSSIYEPYKMGAVIFKGSRILSSGCNEIRGNGRIHPKYKNFDNTIHAEQAAILSLKDWSKAKGSNILVVRINKSGNFSLAYPCPMCQSFLKFLGLNMVYFSNREGNISSIRCRDLLETDYENTWKLE